jgi:hypothetical protein|tara:strand:- start:38 stop:346 length:309 start_codon:yes stop_codon:yes gene_type:complete
LFVHIFTKWVSVSDFTGKTFQVNPILSSQNTEQSFLFMDVSGIGIKAVSILIIPKAEKISGRISFREMLIVINETVKTFPLLVGGPLWSGNVRQRTPQSYSI